MTRRSSRTRTPGLGFVTLNNAAEAQAVIRGLAGENFSGRNLIVNEAKPRVRPRCSFSASRRQTSQSELLEEPPFYVDVLVSIANKRPRSEKPWSMHIECQLESWAAQSIQKKGALLSGVADRLVALEEFRAGGAGQLNPPRRSRINPA